MVVELLSHPVLELLYERFDIDAGHPRCEHASGPADLTKVGSQCLSGSRVLNLDSDPSTVVPNGSMDLADGSRRCGVVVETQKLLPPAWAHLLGQHPMHHRRRHRRGGVLQLGECGAVGRDEILGKGRLEYGHCLAELHRPALELAEHLE